MLFLVKSEVSADKVDELTRKVINHEIKPVKGNLVYLTPDGRFGYDIVEADSESEVKQMYKQYSNYLKFHEITPIMSGGHFYDEWKMKHGKMGGMKGELRG